MTDMPFVQNTDTDTDPGADPAPTQTPAPTPTRAPAGHRPAVSKRPTGAGLRVDLREAGIHA